MVAFNMLTLPLLAISELVQGVVMPHSFNNVEARTNDQIITPKVFIISMFTPEGEVWYGIPDFNLLARNITVPGFSPLFPHAHCLESGEVCQLITGESEINAASTISALLYCGLFNLTSTYFFIGGIGGVNPNQGTIGDVTFAKYAVQVALQYQFAARDKPANFSTGYFPQGSDSPDMYPQSIYGTEVFEVNDALRQKAIALARRAKLNDSDTAVAYRAHYTGLPAAMAPSVRACDVATSDVYFSGAVLGEAFGNYTHLVTNGSGVYCTTAQEDNATLEVLLRGALAKVVDFSRIIVMRTASDFDRPYSGESVLDNLVYDDQGGFEPAIKNIYLAGRFVVLGILAEWEATFAKGVKPTNYIGDMFGSLGGTPDFGLCADAAFRGFANRFLGLPSSFLSNQVPIKRALSRRDAFESQA